MVSVADSRGLARARRERYSWISRLESLSMAISAEEVRSGTLTPSSFVVVGVIS